MKHLEVLVVTEKTTNAKILNWKVSLANHVETAIENLYQKPYKIVAISKEIPNKDKAKLNSMISLLFDEIIVVEYNDESDLSKKVKTTYWSKNKPGYSMKYLDNSFEIKLANSMNLN